MMTTRIAGYAVLTVVLAMGVVAGCGLSSTEKTQSVMLDDGSDPAHPGPSFDVARCPKYPQGVDLDRVCIVDDTGATYPENGKPYALPSAPPYGAYFQFKPGFAPILMPDPDFPGAMAGVGVFAAPYVISGAGGHCCAEDDPANRIAATVVVTPAGGMLVAITHSVPVGDQVAIALDNGELYSGRTNPCDLPSSELCRFASHSGFLVRFYVGSLPSGTSPPTPDAGPPPAGACLLQYNDALVDGDPCCDRKGGVNTCATSVRCNDRSGGGCCLIYGTSSTAGGDRCCLYEDGTYGDGPDECRQLLAAAR